MKLTINQIKLESAAVCVAEIVSAYPIPPHDLSGYSAHAIRLIAKLPVEYHVKLARSVIENHKRFPTIADICDAILYAPGCTDNGNARKSPYNPDNPNDVLWKQILEHLETDLGKNKITKWFNDTEIIQIIQPNPPAGYGLVIAINREDLQAKKTALEWIKSHYTSQIRTAAYVSSGRSCNIWFV